MSHQKRSSHSTAAQDEPASPAAYDAPETGTFETTPIDPVISEPATDTTLIPVVRPAESPPEESESFVKNLTGSIASRWRSAAEEAHLEWQEYDAEAAARAEEAEAAQTRHEYSEGFSLADSAEPSHHTSTGWGDQVAATTSSIPAVTQPSTPTGALELPVTGPSTPLSTSPQRPSVLKPSWFKPKRSGQQRRAPILDRTVFERRISPQQVFNKIMATEKPATASISIVERLAGTPYQNPVQIDHPVESEGLETINFVLDLGEALLRYGAGALEVETSIIAVTHAFGMKNTDADITNQSISLNWAPEGNLPYTRVRVVRSWSTNFKALAAVHELVTDVTAGRLTRTEAGKRLTDITREPKSYPRWMVTIAGAVFASFFASFLGAPILDAATGFIATILVLWITRQLTAWRIPEFYTLAAGGFTATAVGMAAFMLEADVTPSMVVAGGLMILLPSARIVSAIQDAINGFPITAAGRLVSSMIAFAGMTAGIMAAVVLADLLGAPPIEVAEGLTRIYHPTVLVALVFFAAVAAGIVEQTRWRMLIPTGVVSALGFGAYYAGELLGLGERITPILGATVVGALGRVVALRLGAPQLVIAVPAMMFMLPGLMVFRGMYQIAIENSATFMMAGLFQMFNAMIIIMAIAAGIVLGDVIMRPFTSGLQSNERSQTRNR